MSNRSDQIAGLIAESVLTNKLMQRVMCAFQTENLDRVEPELLADEEIKSMISFFKAAQAELNKFLDAIACRRLRIAGVWGKGNYVKRMGEGISPEEFKLRLIGNFDDEEPGDGKE